MWPAIITGVIFWVAGACWFYGALVHMAEARGGSAKDVVWAAVLWPFVLMMGLGQQAAARHTPEREPIEPTDNVNEACLKADSEVL